MKQWISRGYTRALDYLFDNDDDAPVPKPHPGIPLSLHPPPPKQRCQVESARSAESALIAKHCTERLHPYEPATQRVRSAVPATVHELVAPPPPAVPVTNTSTGCISPKAKASKGVYEDPAPSRLSEAGNTVAHAADRRGVRQCRRWCTVADHRSRPIPQEGMANVGSRCYGPPPHRKVCHGGRPALAACP